MPGLSKHCKRAKLSIHHNLEVFEVVKLFLLPYMVLITDQVFSDIISHMTDCHVEKALHMRNVKKICNVDLNIDVEHMKNKL